MAGGGLIRLQLSFDYPPPSAAGCRRCWLLVDRDACRVVADLESLIRDKFLFSRGSVLSLFVQDCYLPHTESVLVVRDNDSVRVKVDTAVNGLSSSLSRDGVKSRKRKCVEEEDQGEVRKKRVKKKSKRREESEEQDAAGTPIQDGVQESPARSTKKKKKKLRPSPQCASSEPAEPPPTTDLQSPGPQRSQVMAGRPRSKPCPPPPSPSDDDSSRTQAPPPPRVSKASDPQRKQTTVAPPHCTNPPQEEEEEEEEIQLVIHPPKQQPWRCGGRGGSRGGRGGSKGGHFDFRAKQPSYEPETPPRTPVVLQNGAEKPNYTLLPLLAAPPQVGQKIAFKLLELTENYTPEVSQYKEGRIISFDPTSRQVELDLLTASPGPSEPGKFDLVYLNPDGSERVEYAVTRGSRVTERWDALLEPRLVL